jgi:hypothetical protein
LKVIAGDEQARRGGAGPHDGGFFCRDESGEEWRNVAECLEIRECESVPSLRGRIPVQPEQLIRVRQIDRPEDVGVDDRERGGEDAEAEADGGGHARREERGAAHPSTRVADVLEQGVNQREAQGIVALLLDPGHATERTRRRQSRFVEADAVRQVLFDLLVEMKPQLCVKFMFGRTSSEDGSH